MTNIIKRIRDWIFGPTIKEIPKEADDEIIIEIDECDDEYYTLLAFTMKRYPKDENSYSFYEFRFDPATQSIIIGPDVNSPKLLQIMEEANALININVANGKDIYADNLACFLEDKINELANTVPIYKDKGLKVVYEEYPEEE